jgi:hypothetical protein
MSGLSLAQQQIATAIINGSGKGIDCIDYGKTVKLVNESGEILVSFPLSKGAASNKHYKANAVPKAAGGGGNNGSTVQGTYAVARAIPSEPPSDDRLREEFHRVCHSQLPAPGTIRRDALLGKFKLPNGQIQTVLHLVAAMTAQEKAAWKLENGLSKKDSGRLSNALIIYSDWKAIDRFNEESRRSTAAARTNPVHGS